MRNQHLSMTTILNEHGGPMPIVPTERPVPGPGQALVRVRASGVNPLDVKIHAGQAAHARHPLPATLGLDLAGEIVALGEGVVGLHPGDEVYGMTGGVGGHPGSLAQFAAVDAALLAKKPTNLSMREAASLPLVFITAWEGLIEQGRVAAGEKVLVLGGAGGVGRVALQLAHAYGATTFAVDDASRLAGLPSLGATPIDRTTAVEDYVARYTGGAGFNLVFDTVGGPALDAAFRAVCRGGRVVSSLGWGTHTLAPLSFRAASYAGVFALLPLLTGEGRARHGDILARAAVLIQEGKIAPHVDPRRFSLETVLDAYQIIREGTAAAKLVVDVG